MTRHLLRRQLLLGWYLRQQRVRVRVMIGLLVWGRVRIKIRIRVRVGVTFNVRIYRLSNCRRSKCRTFYYTNGVKRERRRNSLEKEITTPVTTLPSPCGLLQVTEDALRGRLGWVSWGERTSARGRWATRASTTWSNGRSWSGRCASAASAKSTPHQP